MLKLPIEYLRHIYDECLFLDTIAKTGITSEELKEDEILKRAVTRSLEIMGEATKHLSPEFRERWNQVPWKNIAGIRDRLIHDYIGVNYFIVWDIMSNKISKIMPIIAQIIESEKLEK